jgi:O-antigen/teichoic acid export membrane protein
LLLLASVVTQAVLAWLLLPEGRGLYALFAVLATLLPVAFTFGLDRSIQYHLMSRKTGHAQALQYLLFVWAGAAVCAAAVAIALAGRGTLPSLAESPGLWSAALLLIGASSLYAVLLRMHVAAGRFEGYLGATVAQSLANIVLLLIFASIGSLNPGTAVAALAASYALAAGLSLRALMVPPADESVGMAHRTPPRDFVRYGLSYYPAMLAHAIDFNAGTVILAALATNYEVGIFAAISALMLKFLLLAQAFQEAMLPRIATDQRGRAELVAQLARIAIAVTFLGLLLFAIVSRPVLSLLLSPNFAAGASLVWWMLPGIAIHSGSTLLMPFFEGTGRPGVVSVAVWSGLLVNVVAIALAFPRMGLDSAGLAMTLGMFVRFILLAAPFCRISGLPPYSLFGIRREDWQVLGGLSSRLRRVRG